MSTEYTMANLSSNGTMMAFVCHLSNIALKVIGVVVDVLDPAVGKVDRVMSLPASCSIAMLLLIKTSASVAVSNSIVVVVGNYLMDFVSISVSDSKPKTSMTNARASMVTKTTMSSTEATNLCRA